MGIEIENKNMFYSGHFISDFNSKKKDISDEQNLKEQINKSDHFKELQNRMIPQRNNSAPEYLFDEKSRKLFYSVLFKNEENKEDEQLNTEKNKWKNEMDIYYKKHSYDMSEREIKNKEDESLNDFVLNYYKKGEELRNRYMSQLINKGVWMPSIDKKKYNSIIIFDWDDTLLPTSFLVSKGILTPYMKLSKYETQKILELEELILQLLALAVDKGNVYIITNADKCWVEYSSKLIYPRIKNILQKIKIISAKNKYQEIYPGDSRKWKIKAFVNLTTELNVKKITNIICSGDSVFEIEAGKILASKFTKAFIKTIKFKEKPELEEVYKQILLVKLQFNTIHSTVKNLTIRVEKKKKQ